MKKYTVFLVIILIMAITAKSLLAYEMKGNTISPADTLSTPNPSPEAVALYRYLLDMNGQKMLTGTMWVPWGINEIEYIEGITGELPAIAGFDFIHQSANDIEVQRAMDYWRAGGIPTIMWHWGAPGIGEGYENSLATIDIDRCFIEGTDEYNDFWLELEHKADLLEILRDSSVPVIWRPFHELNGGWFWWSKEGPEMFKQLWITMYNYFVYDRGLNNLIWTLCYSNSPDVNWYPGDEYVDVVGGDTYQGGSDPHLVMYDLSKYVAGNNNYPICYHECGTPPDPDRALSSGAIWSWWMEWHTNHLEGLSEDYLIKVYDHDLNITRDEVSDIVNVYNWDPSCLPSEIAPSIQMDQESWQDTNTVTVRSGTEITFSAEAEGSGEWNWSGCGLTGTSQELSFIVSGKCTATVTYLNDCDAIRTQTFNIIIDDSSVIEYSETSDNSVIIYRIPGEDYLVIELKRPYMNTLNTYRIYSLDGTLVREKITEANSVTINISGLEKGLYLIKVENSDSQLIRKYPVVN
jgi:hypothetical protein